MNKKILLFGLPILAIALVSASVLIYYMQIKQDVTVNQGISIDGLAWNVPISELPVIMNSLEEKTVSSGNHQLKNTADVIGVVKLNSICSATETDNSCVDVVTTPVFKLITIEGSYTEDGATVSYQDRVTAKSTLLLNDINSISFDYKTSDAYIPYVVLGIDTNDNGVYDTDGSDTNLVYSASAGTADQWNTFNVDGSWIATQKGLLGNHKVLQVKVMYGYWGGYYHEATALVKNIKVNDADIVKDNGLVIREFHSEDSLDNQWGDVIVDFTIENYFPQFTKPSTYTMTTEVQPITV